MKIPQGYKQTEVGIIPQDWEVNSIGYVFSTYPTASYTRDQLGDNGDVKYIHYGDLHTKYHTHLNLSWASIPTITYKQALRYMHLRNGDLILADASEDYAGVGNCVEIIGQNNINAISGLHTVLLRDTKSVFADGFRGYITQMAAVKSQLEKQAVGTKVYAISYSTIKDCLLPIPPIEEQRRIAEVLSDVDGLITALDKKIAKKKLIKQAAMQRLFAHKPGNKQSIGEIVSVKKGEMLTSDEFIYGPVPVIAGGRTLAGYHNVANRPARTITISASGASAGFVAFHEYPIFATDCSTISPNSNFNIKYIYYLLQYHQADLYATQTGGAQPHVHPKDIEEIKVSYIDNIEEQQAIVTILSDMDKEISDLERKHDKYKLLKNGIMQKLLTGQIRIK